MSEYSRGASTPYILSAPEPGTIFIKHDVEARMERAVRMARIEAEKGHRATYYIQGDLVKRASATRHVQEISALGHEVAYHYDVLDSKEGNYSEALKEFGEICGLFASAGIQITTVCPPWQSDQTS